MSPFGFRPSSGSLPVDVDSLELRQRLARQVGNSGAVKWGTAAVSLDAVLTFWLASILTRPLGASFGDYLSQSVDDGGLGLGPINTSVIFLVTILALVIYLSVSKSMSRTQPQAEMRECWCYERPRIAVTISEAAQYAQLIER